ncbi:MAG: hypothetical protein FDZ75_04760 [Actinobacteria bacterium]|nr:MAG: hypothetical protein FDZ75_04760 [Actinomycetota bacterium]
MADAVFREVTIALMFVAAFTVTIAISATRVVTETERRTVYNILGHDVQRWHYITGTWAGTFVVTGIVVGLLCVTSIGVGAVVYHVGMWRLIEAAVAVWLEMGVIGAVAIMASTRVGVVTSVVAAAGFAFAGHSLGELITGGNPTVRPPAWIPTLDVFNVVAPVAHGTGYSAGYALTMGIVFVGWVGVLLTIGSSLYAGRDL